MCELTFCANFWHIPLSSLQLRSTIFVGHYSVHQLSVVSATCHYWPQRLNLATMDMTKINETHSTKLFRRGKKNRKEKKSFSQCKSDLASETWVENTNRRIDETRCRTVMVMVVRRWVFHLDHAFTYVLQLIQCVLCEWTIEFEWVQSCSDGQRLFSHKTFT